MTRAQTPRTSSATRGWVAFVGSGPGDPGLLTVRAADLVRSADVVITEGPEHPALIRSVLGLPEGSEGGPELVDGGFGEHWHDVLVARVLYRNYVGGPSSPDTAFGGH